MGAKKEPFVMKGVTRRPSVTPDGLHVESIQYALMHNKYFAVSKQSNKRDHSLYAVSLLKRNGKFAKRVVKTIGDRIFNTEGDAKDAIRRWDLA